MNIKRIIGMFATSILMIFSLITVTVSADDYKPNWATDTDYGYYRVYTDKKAYESKSEASDTYIVKGAIRYLFYAGNVTERDIESSGIMFVVTESNDVNVAPASVVGGGSAGFYADVVNIPNDTATDTKYGAMGFVTRKNNDGTTDIAWSGFVAPTFDKGKNWTNGAHFSEYDCYVEEYFVELDYSDDFLYRIGTVNNIPLDVKVYKLDDNGNKKSTPETMTEELFNSLTFEVNPSVGNISSDAYTFSCSDGKVIMTPNKKEMGGIISVSVYPTELDYNHGDVHTFEVLEGYYNVSSLNTATSGKDFCITEDMKNFTITVSANKTGYGNNHVIDNSEYTTHNSPFGGNVGLMYGAWLDNIRIIGIDMENFTLFSDVQNDASNAYKFAPLVNSQGGKLSNAYLKHGNIGVRPESSETILENVTIYNSMAPVYLYNGTLTLEGDVVIDQYQSDNETFKTIGGGIVANEITTTLNINGNIHFHTFVTKDDTENMPTINSVDVGSVVKEIFDETEYVFEKDSIKYINPAILAVKSNLTLNVSDSSNFSTYYDIYTDTIASYDVKAWAYSSEKVNTSDIEYLWDKPVYETSADFSQVVPSAYNLNDDAQLLDLISGEAQYKISDKDLYFRKYATNLPYSVGIGIGDGSPNYLGSFTYGDALFNLDENGDLNINSSESISHIVLTYKVADYFNPDTTTTYTEIINVAIPAASPTIVFAAPSGYNVGSGDEKRFEYKGRTTTSNPANSDTEFDVDLNTEYGFAAFDYKGNKITNDNGSVLIYYETSGLGNNVNLMKDNAMRFTNVMYINSNSNELADILSDSYTTIKVIYKVADSDGRTTTANRYYQVSNYAKRRFKIFNSNYFYVSLNGWAYNGSQKTFETRNGFSDITISWNNGGNTITSSTNNHVCFGGEIDTTEANLTSTEFELDETEDEETFEIGDFTFDVE